MSTPLVTITEELIAAGADYATGNNWTRRQLALLGVPLPLRTGWKERLIGTQVPQENVRAFLELRQDRERRRERTLAHNPGATLFDALPL